MFILSNFILSSKAHRVQVTPNDIKGNTTIGQMFHAQSIYMMTSTAQIPRVMSCMTFDPPVPVESGIDNQVGTNG